ncbi:MAG: hypothetical protein ACR2MG_14825 [Pyrinomonadaceae bacterium]
MEKKNGKKKIMPNGLRDYSHLPRAKDYPQIPLEEMSPEMQKAVLAGREAIKAIAEAFDKGEISNV